jgi:dolichol kinase
MVGSKASDSETNVVSNTKFFDYALEFRRKTFHVLLGIILVLSISYDIIQFRMCLVILITGLIISFASRNYDVPIINWFLEHFDRVEHKSFPGRGVITIFFSLTVLMLLRDSGIISTNIVLASIMIWTFGDSLSAIIGKTYGKIKHPLNNSRFIEGTASGIVGGALGAFIFVPIMPAIVASFIAILFESLELRLLKRPIDDNILVPLISALILSVLL